jgi:hypothetical protein
VARKSAREIVRRVADRLYSDVGCGDGGCVFGTHPGMHTNGGCRCLHETNPAVLRRRIRQLAEVANVLATLAVLD